jgi:hypothetical protein
VAERREEFNKNEEENGRKGKGSWQRGQGMI